MLNARLNRRPITRLARVAIVIAVVGITLPIATLAQASFSTFSGSVVDPMNGLLQKAKLNAQIATDGTVKDVQVVPPAHPAFASAAIEAVRAWEFDETLLNCAPTEVSMRVSVTFRRE